MIFSKLFNSGQIIMLPANYCSKSDLKKELFEFLATKKS